MTASTLTASDRESLRRQIVSANTVYRAAYAAAERCPSAERIAVAARAKRKRDDLLEEWPAPQEPCS